jgi:hypothetical protein
VIISREAILDWYVARTRKRDRILIRKTEGKRQLGSDRHILEDNINMEPNKIIC